MIRGIQSALCSMALLCAFLFAATSLRGQEEVQKQDNAVLFSAETQKTSTFSSLYSEKGAVVLLVSNEVGVACNLGNFPFKLFEAHKEKLNFVTIINGKPSPSNDRFLRKHCDNVLGLVYYDTEKVLVGRYKPSTETAILFIDKSGNTLAMIPGKDIDKSLLRLGHVMISQL